MAELNTAVILKAATNGDEKCQEQIISENTGLVKSIAKRFFNRGYDPEEIIQLGMIGLYKAIKNFDFSYEVKFSTYAVPMITGEIKRFLRDDNFLKVSRATREQAAFIYEKSSEYETANGVSPSLSELSEITGYSLEDIVFALNSSSSVTSLDSLINDESDSSMLNRIEDEASYFEEKTVDKIMISHILGTLKPRERQVIILRYYSGLTQKEISEKIGVSQVQVSRIEKKVLEKLRETV